VKVPRFHSFGKPGDVPTNIIDLNTGRDSPSISLATGPSTLYDQVSSLWEEMDSLWDTAAITSIQQRFPNNVVAAYARAFAMHRDSTEFDLDNIQWNQVLDKAGGKDGTVCRLLLCLSSVGNHLSEMRSSVGFVRIRNADFV